MNVYILKYRAHFLEGSKVKWSNKMHPSTIYGMLYSIMHHDDSVDPKI